MDKLLKCDVRWRVATDLMRAAAKRGDTAHRAIDEDGCGPLVANLLFQRHPTDEGAE